MSREPIMPDPRALSKAMDLARTAFANDGEALVRLDRALEIVKSGGVSEIGGGDWAVGSQHSDYTYQVNGTCPCADVAWRGVDWCKHRLAVALVKKANVLKEKGEIDALVPEPVRIDLYVTYQTDEAHARPRIHDGGVLGEVKGDGEPVALPVTDLSQVYRWLQDHDYVPEGFAWLDRGTGGHRRRKQTYVKAKGETSG